MRTRKVSWLFSILFGLIVVVFLLYVFGLRVWKGQYTSGFEVSAFQACGAEESWWTTGNIENIASKQPKDIYVEFIGIVSPEGEYGHVGGYKREIDVIYLYSVQEELPKDCR